MCIGNPFFNNKETFGMVGDEVEVTFHDLQTAQRYESARIDLPDWKRRATANRRRGLKMSRQVKQKDIIYDQLHEWWAEKTLTDEQEEFICHFRSKISKCCHHSLFREFADGTKEFIGAHTCKHKLCPVCNAQHSKKVRKVWRDFFEDHTDLMEKYDFMHLTLTVPHSPKGWRGSQWYADELIKEFNWLRKKPFWKSMVYAGEFGVEVTKNDQGYHIHIHSLLLVYKGQQNRNNLHRHILEAWNRQTKGSNSRTAFTPAEQEAIMKGNKSITPEFVGQLFPCGATLIGLESLYMRSNTEKKGYHFCERLGAYKRYVKPADGQDIFLAGIMECIKYHFEPMALKTDGTYDFDLICEILPAIKGKSLYRKFGAFHERSKNSHPDCKRLSLSWKEEGGDIDEMVADVAEFGRENINHPDTGEIVSSEEFRYFLVALNKVFFDPEDDNKPSVSPGVKVKYLNARTVIDAMVDMETIAMQNQYGTMIFKPIQQLDYAQSTDDW